MHIAPRARSHRLLAIALVVAVAVAVIVVGIRSFGEGASEAAPNSTNGQSTNGQSTNSQPTNSQPVTPSPLVKPSTLPRTVTSSAPRLDAREKVAASKAGANLVSFVAAAASALGKNDGKADVTSMAAGPAAGEVQSLSQQYELEHMTVSGTPKVLGTRVVSAELSADPPTVALAVCLDNRPVKVKDANGRDLGADRSPSELTVLNLYELQQLKGKWLVVNRSIPADSSCDGLEGP